MCICEYVYVYDISKRCRPVDLQVNASITFVITYSLRLFLSVSLYTANINDAYYRGQPLVLALQVLAGMVFVQEPSSQLQAPHK